MSLIEELFSLAGRTAVVTGASRGLGRAMAEALAGAGADIVAVASRPSAEMDDLGRTVTGLGRSFTAYPVDLRKRPAIQAFVADLQRDHPKIDILVNNAGAVTRRPAIEHSDEDWDPILELDLTVPFVLAREIGRGMVERRSGKIIFTSSALGFQGGLNVVSYAAAKTGLLGVTRALANEWASLGVNVNAIAPGYMATDFTTALRADSSRNGAIFERIPAQRWGVPEDLAGAIVFLASKASDYVHGSVVVVNGGWLGR
jgi:2-deoxy-D-gluconate 3-dehydrogenase